MIRALFELWGVVAFFVVISVFARRANLELRTARSEPAIVSLFVDYKEYDTPEAVEKLLLTKKKTLMPCNYCGMSDLPVYIPDNHWSFGTAYGCCFWCAELAFLNLHLKINGTR